MISSEEDFIFSQILAQENNIKFRHNYELIDILDFEIYNYDNRKKLLPKRERVCRFCGKGYPAVKFNSDAHLIPESLGNKEMLSDFECDKCNHFFGKKESDLANFLGIARSLAKIQGKKKDPVKFFSPDKTVKIETLQNDALLFTFSNPVITPYFSQFEGDEPGFTIHYRTEPFTPIHAYKALIKIGLSLLEKSEIDKFPHCIKFLMTEDYDNSRGMAVPINVSGFPTNYPFNRPKVCVYKKRELKAIMPTYIISIYTACSMVSFHMPYYQPDIFAFHKNRPEYIYPPIEFENNEDSLSKKAYNVPHLLTSTTKITDNSSTTFRAKPDFYLQEENKFVISDGKKIDANLLIGMQVLGGYVQYAFKNNGEALNE